MVRPEHDVECNASGNSGDERDEGSSGSQVLVVLFLAQWLLCSKRSLESGKEASLLRLDSRLVIELVAEVGKGDVVGTSHVVRG